MSSVKRHGSMSSSAHPRGHHGEHHELAHTLPAHHHYDTEWEAKEELRLRELEEARARAAQMEKTMRWWSDCTANWREKWSKVRTERNKSREESRILRTKFDASVKECNNLKREKQDLINELDNIREEILQLKLHKNPNNNNDLPLVVTATPERDVTSTKRDKIDLKRYNMNNANSEGENDHEVVTFKSEMVQTSPVLIYAPTPDLEYLNQLLKPEKDIELEAISKDNSFEGLNNELDKNGTDEKVKMSPCKLIDSLLTPTQDYKEQRLSLYQLRLEEAVKTLQAEREEKSQLDKTLEKVQQELNQMKMKFEDIKQSKQEALKELNQVKAEHQDEIEIIRLDLEDETNSRSSMDRRVADLRSQLETLQAENAVEWGKRERLETEKLTLERETKKLKTHIQDLEERLDRRSKQLSSASDSDCKSLQQEIHDKNKELAELKHAHLKLKKILQDKTTELGHAIRRSDQYEAEVKKLRLRVEELKKELAVAEDEVDSATNNIRKLQRTNDELQEQVDSLQVQVEHLQARLRSTNHSLISRRGSASKLHTDLSEDESTN